MPLSKEKVPYPSFHHETQDLKLARRGLENLADGVLNLLFAIGLHAHVCKLLMTPGVYVYVVYAIDFCATDHLSQVNGL